MIKKNDLFEAEITAMTAEGSGICRADVPWLWRPACL